MSAQILCYCDHEAEDHDQYHVVTHPHLGDCINCGCRICGCTSYKPNFETDPPAPTGENRTRGDNRGDAPDA